MVLQQTLHWNRYIDTYSNYRDLIVLTTNATRLYMILADEDCLMKDTDCTVMSGEP